MSFSELLEAVQRLPRGEKIRLLHELVDQIGRTPEEVMAERYGIAPGTVCEVWFPEPNPNAVAAVHQALSQQRGI